MTSDYMRKLMETVVSEKWNTDTEIKQTGEWADYTIAELQAKKKKLKDKETRTKAETKDLRQINFAIRAKRDWKKTTESVNEAVTEFASVEDEIVSQIEEWMYDNPDMTFDDVVWELKNLYPELKNPAIVQTIKGKVNVVNESHDEDYELEMADDIRDYMEKHPQMPMDKIVKELQKIYPELTVDYANKLCKDNAICESGDIDGNIDQFWQLDKLYRQMEDTVYMLASQIRAYKKEFDKIDFENNYDIDTSMQYQTIMSDAADLYKSMEQSTAFSDIKQLEESSPVMDYEQLDTMPLTLAKQKAFEILQMSQCSQRDIPVVQNKIRYANDVETLKEILSTYCPN